MGEPDLFCVEVIIQGGSEETWTRCYDFTGPTEAYGPKTIGFKSLGPNNEVISVNYVIMNIISWTVIQAPRARVRQPMDPDAGRYGVDTEAPVLRV